MKYVSTTHQSNPIWFKLISTHVMGWVIEKTLQTNPYTPLNVAFLILNFLLLSPNDSIGIKIFYSYDFCLLTVCVYYT